MDYGIKIARNNSDVRGASKKDLVLDSSINVLKIYKEVHGTVSLAHSTGFGTDPTLPNNAWTYTETHNFGYNPTVFFYIKHPTSGKWSLMLCNMEALGDFGLIGGYRYSDVNNVQFYMYDTFFSGMPSSPTTVEYKYYILLDPAKDAWYSQTGGGVTTGTTTKSDYGLKISRPGKDVKSVLDSDLVWSSDWNTFKIYSHVSLAVDEVVAHGLTYAPTFFFYTEVVSGKWVLGNIGYLGGGTSYCKVDSTNVYNTSGYAQKVILCIDPLYE